MRMRPHRAGVLRLLVPEKTDADQDKRPILFGAMQPFDKAMLRYFKSGTGHGRLTSITAPTSAIIGD